MWISDSVISSTAGVRSSGAGRIDVARASTNSAWVSKWWKNDPVVTPAAAATLAVVTPAKDFESERSSTISRPARTRRSLGSSVVGGVDGRLVG